MTLWKSKNMKRKKLVVTIIIFMVAILCVFGLRLYSLGGATWDYFHTDVVCSGRHPTPPKGLGEPAPLPIYEVKPFTVINDMGNMYPGDEYIMPGEGWSGVATLLWAGSDGATFTVKFQSSGYPEYICRWFIPIGNYR